MHNGPEAAIALADAIARGVSDDNPVEVAVAPPAVCLAAVKNRLIGSRVHLAAQNVHQAREGAFTGEVSVGMLREVGVDTVILGHSERRSLFSETDAAIHDKVRACLDGGLRPMLCVGETLAERDAGDALSRVESQLRQGFAAVGAADVASVVLAYEPVWAIGTGRTATPVQAEQVHAHLRATLEDLFPQSGASVRILYGGSVKPGNARDLFGQPNIDGGLIGGASLKPSDFLEIVAAAHG